MNSNFSLCVLTDTARTITASHTFSGVQKFADGTAASPGVQFANDGNCGMVRTGTDAWGLSVGGAIRLSLSTTGVTVTGTLTATDGVTFQSTLSVTGAVSVASTINGQTIDSASSFTGTLAVSGAVTLSNNLSVGGTLSVTGNSTLSGTLAWGGGSAITSSNNVVQSTNANTWTANQTFSGQILANGSIRVGSGGTLMSALISATTTWDIPSTAAGNFQTTTVTVTGAAVGDLVIVSQPHLADSSSNDIKGYVSGADTVTLVYQNTSTSISSDPTSRTVRVVVLQF